MAKTFNLQLPRKEPHFLLGPPLHISHHSQLLHTHHRLLSHFLHVQNQRNNHNGGRREFHPLSHHPQRHRQQHHLHHIQFLVVRRSHQTPPLLHSHRNQLLADSHAIQSEETQTDLERLRHLSGRCQFKRCEQETNEQSGTACGSNDKNVGGRIVVVLDHGISARDFRTANWHDGTMFLFTVLSEFRRGYGHFSAAERFDKFHLVLLHESDVSGNVWTIVQT